MEKPSLDFLPKSIDSLKEEMRMDYQLWVLDLSFFSPYKVSGKFKMIIKYVILK